jgi:hypothetical protein
MRTNSCFSTSLQTNFALLFLASASTTAQVPEGGYVFSTFRSASVGGGEGLYFVHPRTPGSAIPVTGLGADLSFSCTPTPAVNTYGASCVLRRPSDGALIVGERAPSGCTVDLHVLTLAGSAVATDTLYPIGVSNIGGEIPQAALLPNGDILVAVSDVDWASLLGLAIVTPSTGAVTPIPVTLPGMGLGVVNALVVDSAGTTAYFAMYVTTDLGDVYSVPVPGGGLASLVASVPAGVSNLAFDLDGDLLATCLGGPPNLFEIDPGTGTVTAIPTSIGTLNAIAVETVTGNYAVLTANAGIPPRSVYWMLPDGSATLLCDPGLAITSGIDVNPNPETYGPPSPGANEYTWTLAPNPGGLPTVGNAFFGLTLASAPGTAPGILAVGLQAASIPFGTVTILVDPASLLFLHAIPASPSTTIPLPIPPARVLVGATVYFQTFHLEPGGVLAASRGLAATVL